MTKSLPLGAITPDGKAFRVSINQWVLAVTHPDGPKDPLARGVLLAMVLHWADWNDGARMFAGKEKGALASGRSAEDVRQSLAYGCEQGWLWRYSVRGTNSKYSHDVFEITLPIAWLGRLNHLRDWEKDPNAIEEALRTRKLEHGARKRTRRGKNRGRTARGRVDRQRSAHGGGAGSQPQAESQPGTENDSAQGCTTSSSTSPETHTSTSSDSLMGIGARLRGKRLRDAARRQPDNVNYVSRMANVLTQLQSELKGFDLRREDHFLLAKAACGMTEKTNEEVLRIIKQLDDEGLLTPPYCGASDASQQQPHGEPASSTPTAESPTTAPPAAAEG